jgi:hypothetical protein
MANCRKILQQCVRYHKSLLLDVLPKNVDGRASSGLKFCIEYL